MYELLATVQSGNDFHGRACIGSSATSAAFRTITPTAITAWRARRCSRRRPSRRRTSFRFPSRKLRTGRRTTTNRCCRSYYGAEKLDPQRPLFDAVLLGLGDDGHTASLFPGTLALTERHALGCRTVVGAMPQPRITLTYPVLESSRAVAFLVSGAGKREALRRVWRGDDLPAARLRPQGELIWFIDRAADPRSA